MVRVLHIVFSMNRGGIETILMNIFRNIDRSKLMFDFLVHTKEDCAYDEEIRALGGRIYSVPSRRAGLLKNRRALDAFFKAHPEYKIVHQHVSSMSYVEPLKAAKRAGVPVRIIHVHGTSEGASWLHVPLHYLNRLGVKRLATHYFACSDLAARWLYGARQFRAKEYCIINNGTQPESFVFNPETRERIREELHLQNKFVIGLVGRFHYLKNHIYLLDAFSKLHERAPDAVLLLVGDGELREEITSHIQALGLEAAVVLTGMRPDVPEVLQAIDVFCMPSFHEGLPLSVIEAQGAGLPCLLSDTITKQVAITDLVQYLSIKRPPEDWAEKLMQMRGIPRRDTCSELVAAGFDLSGITQELQSLYLDLGLKQ
ncbi:glycosyltransferase family 1 protein [Acetanaerobacterium elongatum]|uniref:Glycosyltransferase involved in cell wall bisynthesis n=1 Tax=Acetanaerobacterium elongatum TaxID=258515 RepID=A0A1G9Z3L3_9FIRM|nr:glycosyltransferase family 1 protein [Acetanaerobacterium elongatum]SDN15889.1 Glycosyltransferase involved in cell wall bisynthesis [Acetanaerobacterium elongatum]